MPASKTARNAPKKLAPNLVGTTRSNPSKKSEALAAKNPRKSPPKKSTLAPVTKPGKSQDGYLHGFTATEQSRLYHQARFLEDHVFDQVDFTGCKHILEVGSGVGAQTEILRERFPKVKITCVDASKEQVSQANKRLATSIKKGLVTITQANAQKMPFVDGTFDGAFVTWFLEHVSDPIGILKETRRVLRRGAVIHINEVLNHSFFVHPYSPATLKYWAAFNDHQWKLKGDPYVGAKLGNYLLAANFQKISTSLSYWHLDRRQPELRARFADYWIDLLLSGSAELEKSGKVTKILVKQMTTELRALRNDPDSVFFMGFMKAHATAP
jgi:ubiquinone/menaquinone biosynthesis C-methylase UbiE